ncbi:MAG: M28 family peptidase [Dehalococcoidia bacterium]
MTAAIGNRGAVSSSSPAVPADPVALARSFDGAAALEIVKTLADPSYQGRHIGTPGEMKGAEFLASAFAQAGLKPGGDGGSFLQVFPVTVEELASVPILDLSNSSGGVRSLHLRDDFRPIYGGTAGAGDVQAPSLFGGMGRDLAGLDVAGKVLFIIPREPIRDAVSRARDAGAVAVIVPTGETTLLKGEGRAPDSGAIPVFEVSRAGSAALLEGSGHTREELNAALQNNTALPHFALAWTVHLAASLRPPAVVQGHNVVGIRPGTSVAGRTVIIGAHYEEIGPDPDGAVYPAANDNASGTAVLVQLAHLLGRSNAAPDSTIIFAAWSGHEEGLYGSQYYAAHPLLPISATALYLNIDTVGQGAGSNLVAFASDAATRSLLAGAISRLQMVDSSLPVQATTTDEGASDHETFDHAGVPTLALNWSGIIEDGRLHTLADTADTVDPAKLKTTGQVAALAAVLASP